ncbi:P22_AR-like protein [Pseudomonas sp. GM79]|uniref:phage antirepressor N-terminal domain-containing protein n=1 Tax=Pseudomonas sp. GM79 TaxID=1144338 RepID=UPI00026F7CAB|nr:phage antirepressor N-terminal domain-containing protein [Pseudomonas sp. GM79]EJN17226.1 P22_AR-like protein [Pseudomonas sp. GM79]
MSALMTVPFHGVNLMLVDLNGQPYVPMRPVVEGIGLDWGGQHKKLTANPARWGVSVTEIPSAGGIQQVACLPLRKLAGWLSTVQTGRVKDERVRNKIVEYQNECDDALWKYWNDGHAVNSRSHPPAANDSAVEFGRLALAHLPNLGDTSKQALLSHISELAFGQRLIPLPKVEESLKLAGEVGQLFGVSAQKIGRLANQHGLKTDQYGELRLDKSKYSDRQCETFFYNSAAVDRFQEILGEG